MPFAFIIPLVSPRLRSREAYSNSERILRLTVDSLLRQDSPDCHVIVVCHRRPEWHQQYAGRAHFLLVDEGGINVPNIHFLDKGMKYICGALFADRALHCEHIMLMDGDDFASISLVSNLLNGSFGPPGPDGWIVTKGLHVSLSLEEQCVVVWAAYNVGNFDKNCGSCRIFRSEALLGAIRSLVPSAYTSVHIEGLVESFAVSNSLRNEIFSSTDYTWSLSHPFNVLGNHIRQDVLFQLNPIVHPVMAKGCGHGAHDARGEVYWYRVTSQYDVLDFISRFGLSNDDLVEVRPVPMNQFKTMKRAWKAFFLEIPPSVGRRFRAMLAK